MKILIIRVHLRPNEIDITQPRAFEFDLYEML